MSSGGERGVGVVWCMLIVVVVVVVGWLVVVVVDCGCGGGDALMFELFNVFTLNTWSI